MKRTRLVAVAWGAIVSVGLGASCQPVAPAPADEPERTAKAEEMPPVPEADLTAVAAGNNEFAIDLYKRVAATTEGNIVLSPFSVRTALAMTYAGARGNTAAEMAKALSFALPPERLHPSFAATSRQLTAAAKPGTLEVANALWVQDGVSIGEPFTTLTRRHYRAGLETVDFGRAEAAAKRINGWVAERTRDKIPELIKPGMLSSQTVMLLTNAIYLNCQWATPFPVAQTQVGDFELAPGITAQVPLMRLENTRLRYARKTDYTMLELPYVGDQLAMWVILPTRSGGLQAVEEKLTAEFIADTAQLLRIGEATEVILPRFTSRCRFMLNEPLQAMGMRQAFSPEADFSDMLPDSGASIAAVIHEGVIEVDERGTVAAAATAVRMLVFQPPVFRFRADHPFVFMVGNRATGAVLFMGRYVKPT